MLKKPKIPSTGVYLDEVYSRVREILFRVHSVQEYPSFFTFFTKAHPLYSMKRPMTKQG